MLQEQLVELAKAHITEHFPDWIPELERPAVVSDQNNNWMITFALPPGTLGGSPVVLVDKESLEVIRAYHTQ